MSLSDDSTERNRNTVKGTLGIGTVLRIYQVGEDQDQELKHGGENARILTSKRTKFDVLQQGHVCRDYGLLPADTMINSWRA